MALNHFLGNWRGEGPVPKERVFAHRKRNFKDGVTTINFQFAFQNKDGEWVPTPPCEIEYGCYSECVNDGILRYLAENHRNNLSEVVFRLVESEAGREQSDSRDWRTMDFRTRNRNKDIQSRYYIFYRTYGQRNIKTLGQFRKKSQKIAVARFLTRDAIVFALLNNNYHTEKKIGISFIAIRFKKRNSYYLY